MQTNIPGQVINGQPQGHPPQYGQPQPVHYQPQMQQAQYGQQVSYGIARPLPVQVVWMQRPTVTGCPLGLEYLTQIDQLIVKQWIDMFEVMTGYSRNNKYDVKNVLGQTVYRAKEDTDSWEHYCCGPRRQFKIHIYDNTDQEVIQLKREHRCRRKKCGLDQIRVESPPGVTIGYVKHIYHGCKIHYAILNANKTTVLRIAGPGYCHCYCPGDDIPFEVLSASGDIEVGKIAKVWSNLAQEYFTDADNFGIKFPIDLEVKMKAVVLGAVFLIDFNFFEGRSQRQRQY